MLVTNDELGLFSLGKIGAGTPLEDRLEVSQGNFRFWIVQNFVEVFFRLSLCGSCLALLTSNFLCGLNSVVGFNTLRQILGSNPLFSGELVGQARFDAGLAIIHDVIAGIRVIHDAEPRAVLRTAVFLLRGHEFGNRDSLLVGSVHAVDDIGVDTIRLQNLLHTLTAVQTRYLGHFGVRRDP